MNIQSKKTLMQQTTKYYTLTVVTNPASATCTLTYDGVNHNETMAIVKAGTTISYSIYHATYGTTTGSIVMDKNKTLLCTGTYSTTPVTTEQSWTRPNLSSNGTLGGSAFAVDGSTAYNTKFQVWHAFDNGGAGTYSDYYSGVKSGGFITMSFPYRMKLTNLNITNCTTVSGTSGAITSGSVVACDDNSSWVTITSFSNSQTTAGKAWDISMSSNTGFYKYCRINVTGSAYKPSGGGYFGAKEIKITATYQTTTTQYTYYWNKSVT